MRRNESPCEPWKRESSTSRTSKPMVPRCLTQFASWGWRASFRKSSPRRIALVPRKAGSRSKIPRQRPRRGRRMELFSGTPTWSNGYLRETEVSNVIQVSFFGLAVLVSASSISMAQSMPNYGPNPPSNTDSFGQVPSGAKPPGVSRYGHRAYAYVPNQHRHHYRYWHHRHWY